MTEDQIDAYRSGYWECRRVILGRLREVFDDPIDCRDALGDAIERLEADEEKEHWESVQREVPGITRDEYEAELEADGKAIREAFYSPAGLLKPRIVRADRET